MCDARVARRLPFDLSAALEVRNLFDARYGDPGSKEHVQDQIQQDARNLFVTLSYPATSNR